jgi:hypothetical protein
MNKPFLFAAILICGASFAQASNPPQSGTVISETSVACGSKIGKKKTSVQLLCQEYVVRAAGTDFHIRQLKPGDEALIPVDTPIEFTLDKDKIKFKVNGKSHEYLVVSEAPSTQAQAVTHVP